MRPSASTLTLFSSWLFATLLAILIATAAPVRAAVDIPVFPSASEKTSRDYKQWPPAHPDPHIDAARVVIYRVPQPTTAAAVADYYAQVLGKAHWDQGPVKQVGDNTYYFFTRPSDQMIILVKKLDEISVEALGLSFTHNQPPPVNFGTATLTRKIGGFPANALIRINCPAGSVHVQAVPGADVELEATAHAAVDYPLIADPYLKKLQPSIQSDAGGLTLGIDPQSLPDDTSVRLACHYKVVVPTGANLIVTVQKSASADLKVPDGKVDVEGPVGDVTITTPGAVSVTDSTGKVTVNSSGGSILLNHLRGDISAHTSGIWIKAYDITLAGAVELQTTDSRIEIGLNAVQSGQLRCITSNAPIKISTPPASSIDWTISGADKCEGPVALAAVAGNLPRLHGVANGGKVPFYLETSGGATVYVEKK